MIGKTACFEKEKEKKKTSNTKNYFFFLHKLRPIKATTNTFYNLLGGRYKKGLATYS